MSAELDNHQRGTLAKILDHLASGSIEWREVLSFSMRSGQRPKSATEASR